MNTLPYELAKQLKDAGFPASADTLHAYNDDGELMEYDTCCDRWPNGPAEADAPTLSQLIEVCGEELVSMYNNGSEWLINEEAGSDVPQVRGNTPEEAVARLWLALNV